MVLYDIDRVLCYFVIINFLDYKDACKVWILQFYCDILLPFLTMRSCECSPKIYDN